MWEMSKRSLSLKWIMKRHEKNEINKKKQCTEYNRMNLLEKHFGWKRKAHTSRTLAASDIQFKK